MRKILLAVGIALVAAALVALASTDTQLMIALFGSSQIPSSSQRVGGFQPGEGFVMQPGEGFVPQPSGALSQQTVYVKVASYLLGAGGLVVIILGLTLPPRVKEKKEEIGVEAPSQPPPWESSDIPGVKSEESNP